MKIHVSIFPNVEQSNDTIELDDLGFTEEQWKELSLEDKRFYLQQIIDDGDYIVATLGSFIEKSE